MGRVADPTFRHLTRAIAEQQAAVEACVTDAWADACLIVTEPDLAKRIETLTDLKHVLEEVLEHMGVQGCVLGAPEANRWDHHETLVATPAPGGNGAREETTMLSAGEQRAEGGVGTNPARTTAAASTAER